MQFQIFSWGKQQMLDTWWHLTGHRQFIQRIVSELRDGKNITIAIPDHNRLGFYQALRDAEGAENFQWKRISVKNQLQYQKNPVAFLHHYFTPETPITKILQISDLFQLESFLGAVIWLEDIPVDAWDVWCSFLEEYQHACGAIDAFNRSLFCVPIMGKNNLQIPKAEIRLSFYRFCDVTTSLDMLNYLRQNPYIQRNSVLESRVMESVITGLAMWDSELADRLIKLNLNEVFAPIPVLQSLALERDWLDSESEKHWYLGKKNHFDGVERTHSCLLKGVEGEREIKRRVWRGQVSVLLPFIEEERLALLDRLDKYLQIPYATDYGIISDMLDLEIGHIHTQIYLNYDIDRRLKQQVSMLKKMRNQLSHLSCVSAEQLSDYKQFIRASSTI
jgi:hypothetical protein